MRALVFAAAAAAACTYPDKQLVPQGPPFGCLGQPLPSTADMKVTISGVIQDPFSGDFIAGAAVQGFVVGTQTPIFQTTTDSNGMFTHDQGTGGVPRDAYLEFTANNYVSVYYYPAVPIVHDIMIGAQMFTASDLGTISMVANLTIDPMQSTIVTAVVDCNGQAVPGATVTSNPPPQAIRYFANAMPSPTATSTDAMTGAGMLANVPPGTAMVGAQVSGMTLRTHNVTAVANALIETEVQP